MERCAAYRDRGLDALQDHRRGGNHRTLTPAQVEDLTAKLRQYTPRSLFGPEAATVLGPTCNHHRVGDVFGGNHL
jgi:transposase